MFVLIFGEPGRFGDTGDKIRAAMNIKAGTVGEVVPGSGLTSYPVSTTTGINNAIPHFGYVATLGYFGETIHGSNLLSGESKNVQNGPDGIGGIDSHSSAFNGGNDYSTKQITSALSQGNLFLSTATTISMKYADAPKVVTNYQLGASTRTSYTHGYPSYIVAGVGNTAMSSSTQTIRHDYALSEVHGTKYGGTGYQVDYINGGNTTNGESTRPRELEVSGNSAIGQIRSRTIVTPYTTGWGSGPDSIHTTPASVKWQGYDEFPEYENGYQSAQLSYTVNYWPLGPKEGNEDHLSVIKKPVTDNQGLVSHGKYDLLNPYSRFEIKDGELLTEPGYYLLNPNRIAGGESWAYAYTHTPVTQPNSGNAKVDGKRGKGKEWVMIEEYDYRKEGR